MRMSYISSCFAWDPFNEIRTYFGQELANQGIESINVRIESFLAY